MLLVPKKGPWRLCAESDADWAGSSDRKSTSGCVVLLNQTLVHSHSRTQASIALSSCEAELYGMMSTAVELLFVRTWMEEQGQTLLGTPTLYTDSSSALALCGRRGPGRVKHLDIRILALQTWNRENRLSLAKLPTADNRADILTKPMTRETLQRHAKNLGLTPVPDEGQTGERTSKAEDHRSDTEPQ